MNSGYGPDPVRPIPPQRHQIRQYGVHLYLPWQIVNIYEGLTSRIEVSKYAVIKGWCFPHAKLWKVLLYARINYLKTHDILFDGTTGTESLNLLYSVPSTTNLLNQSENFIHERPSPLEAINYVYKIPIFDSALHYLHSAAGFTTKATWIKNIRMGNYFTWPLLTVNNFNNFPIFGRDAKESYV